MLPMSFNAVEEIEVHPYRDLSGLAIQLGFCENDISTGDYLAGGMWFSDTISIICGTFPPKKEYFLRTGYLHYSSSKNQFWKHIDAVFSTKLFAALNDGADDLARIENAKQKIAFLRKKKLGFVDIFSKISRKVADAKDDNLIAVETIFESGVFFNLYLFIVYHEIVS